MTLETARRLFSQLLSGRAVISVIRGRPRSRMTIQVIVPVVSDSPL